jgi:tetratricopeptide (TPR) repeat protein
MKLLLILLCVIFFSIDSFTQDINILIKSADKQEAIPDEAAAFLAFKQILKLQPTNMYALNKCSELCSRIGERQKDKRVRNDYYEAANTYAGIALKLDSNNAQANCVMAIALGKSSLSKSGKEKIISAKEIKKFVDRSIKNDPQNFIAWHVLGKWNYELGSLNIVERSAAKLFYGNIPDGSIQGAIIAFEKSKSIYDGFILNYLEMAKAYQKNGESHKAIECIKKMLLMPNRTEDDPTIKEQGKKLLKDWS